MHRTPGLQSTLLIGREGDLVGVEALLNEPGVRLVTITGGGGFGKGIAAEFVKQGANVIIADFVEEVGQKTAGELKCEFVRVDVTKKEDWEKLVKFADEKFGRLDVVVNNAGTTYRNKV